MNQSPCGHHLSSPQPLGTLAGPGDCLRAAVLCGFSAPSHFLAAGAVDEKPWDRKMVIDSCYNGKWWPRVINDSEETFFLWDYALPVIRCKHLQAHL